MAQVYAPMKWPREHLVITRCNLQLVAQHPTMPPPVPWPPCSWPRHSLSPNHAVPRSYHLGHSFPPLLPSLHSVVPHLVPPTGALIRLHDVPTRQRLPSPLRAPICSPDAPACPIAPPHICPCASPLGHVAITPPPPYHRVPHPPPVYPATSLWLCHTTWPARTTSHHLTSHCGTPPPHHCLYFLFFQKKISYFSLNFGGKYWPPIYATNFRWPSINIFVNQIQFWWQFTPNFVTEIFQWQFVIVLPLNLIWCKTLSLKLLVTNWETNTILSPNFTLLSMKISVKSGFSTSVCIVFYMFV